MPSRRRSLRALRAYPKLQHGEHLRAWAYTIASRIAIDEHRRPRADADLPELAALDGRPAFAQLEHLADELPPTERAAVVLRYGYDLDYAEIGAALGSNATAASQAASAGIRRLRQKELSMNAVSPELDRRFRDAAAEEGLLDAAFDFVDSPVGPLLVATSARGLCRISYDADPERELEQLARDFGVRVLRSAKPIDPARRELDEYFEGKRHTFDLPIDVALLADFNRRVLRELARVPYGEVVTYGELAARSARPRAARAVGTVMNRNPLPIVLPCHRVVGANGKLRATPAGSSARRRCSGSKARFCRLGSCIAGEPSAARSTASPPLPTTASVEAAGQDAHLTQVEVARAFPHDLRGR